MRTRGAVLERMGLPRPYGDSRPLRIAEVELDDPGPGELLVRMVAAGLCHSDLSSINGDRPRAMPLLLGHEASGVVQAVGPHVSRFAPGDHVVLVFAPSCGHCLPCAEGRPALCEPAAVAAGQGSLITGAKRIREGGQVIDHHIGVSAFAEHAVVAEASCVRIDPSIPLDRAALLGCAVLTGVGAVINTGALKAGQSCAIVGLGGVGLAALLGAVAAGARQVIAVDISDQKLQVARDLGATHTVNSRDPDALAQLRQISGGGVDLAVELAGVVPALEFAYEAARRGGTVVTAGLPNPDARMSLAPVTLTAGEKSLKGSYMGSCVPMRDIPRFAEMMMAGKLPIEKLVTHELTLDQINEGFERLADGSAIRQLIRF
ncbi:zinc-dependent alcohol dehydrogenase family protein [Paracoccus fistulariae]|uniref:Zinc-dependent alcohol dehydrogenase family protein n=1 Tax=Paracoccus fistulariae TaxID=658446 RepID=A0ABY7SPS7_9RHOB|nr:zinc-dependent alcohol dehydrogenase family protein [Paracoccus fistulariae]MDB6179917.1 zinc-dependent alcohol dehydrogenase family protein [Paracoccus fistulariae]WCR08017.1 zinc-dependent alcohol dehydrogenase family protein [Paracoccus fistulariae]